MTSPIKPLGGKRLTKDDIEKLRQSLPKRMDITPEGVTTSCEDSEEAIAPILEDKAPQVEVPLSAEEIRAFQVYASMLRETNKVMNLTAVTDSEGIAMKHFIDSLTLCPYIRREEERAGHKIKLADVGTGAGFPGIPLKISMPEVEVTLLDSLAKRLNFLKSVIDRLGLKGTALVHARAEDGGRDKRYREKFDIATARAVAALPVLAEYCLPFVKVGGVFLAMKGKAEEEISSAERAVTLLGGRIEQVDTFTLPGSDLQRTIIVIRKERPTPAIYPRKAGTPAKSPL